MAHIARRKQLFPCLSKQITPEWGQFGIRSNAVCPCFVKTPLSKKFYEDKEVEEGRTRMIAIRRNW